MINIYPLETRHDEERYREGHTRVGTVLVGRGDFRYAGVSFDIRLSAVGSGIEGEYIYLSTL